MSSKEQNSGLLDFNAQSWQCRDILSSKSNYRLSLCVVLLLLVYCPGSPQRHGNACKSPLSFSLFKIAAGYDFCHRVSKQQIVANGHPSVQMIVHANGCLDCNLQEKQYDPIETPRVVSSTLQCCIPISSLCNIIHKSKVSNTSLISLEMEEEGFFGLH